MASDLGGESPEVHARAREVLGFWFEMLMPEQHFARSDAVDTAIADRFADLREAVLASSAQGWRDDPETLLAAVIVLDQFSRNLFRDDPRAYAADPLAQELTQEAIAKGWDVVLAPERRAFLYMPLMHAEDAGLQAESVRRFTALGLSQDYAEDHAAVIAQFGRFPTRNAALGRDSTPEERDYLSRPDAGW
ncbi:DUF924 family protein [Sphingomonas sp. CJ20]